MKKIKSWNRIPRLEPDHIHRLDGFNPMIPSDQPQPYLAYGNGRSYSDVCLNDKGTLIETQALGSFINFDEKSGRLACGAGVTLLEILSIVVPRGWFLSVTPGTQFVTLGGAIANDVHGKNHHETGSFGNHVTKLSLLRSNNELIECSTSQNRELFKATIGGLGLTGVICWAEIQLIKIQGEYIRVSTQRFRCIDEFWEASDQAQEIWPYTVAWIDCIAKGENLGRGVLFKGEHTNHHLESTTPHTKNRTMNFPVEIPFSLVNGTSVKLFNSLYYNYPRPSSNQLMHYKPYFYPLDRIINWNRIYGAKGFYQYQCVIPRTNSKKAIKKILSILSTKRLGSFLAVLKNFGDIPSIGMLSFPRQGVTLALDFPNLGSKTLELFAELDSVVLEYEGALYPAKDARMPPHMFKHSFPMWKEFETYIDNKFSSSFWERVSK